MTPEPAPAEAGEFPPPPESAEIPALHEAIAEPEPDTSGDFREPHPEEPLESAVGDEDAPEDLAPEEIAPISESPVEPPIESASEPAAEPVAEVPPATEPAPVREPQPERERPPARPPAPQSRRPEPKPWVKPADFRPAETSAISQAVAHATEIAESLKHTLDHLEEILELVELAERQKLADEREIDELRRALRRIQPPRQQPSYPPRGPRHEDQHRGYREHHAHPRQDEPRPPRSEEPRSSSATEPPAQPF